MPRFSVIIPVYNVQDYLEQCVDSVLNQDYRELELVLVDDGSKDNSGNLCDNYAEKDGRVVSVHQENSGASSARNNGLDKASGQYTIFLDSDDYWADPTALSQINAIIEEKEPDIVVFGCTDFNMNTGEEFVSRSNYDLDLINEGNKESTLHYFLSNKLLPGNPNVFCFRKDIADNIRFKLGVQDEDYDFVLSVFLNSDSVFAINNPFYMYRKGRGDSVTGASSIKMIYGIEYTLDKWLPICDTIESEIIKKDVLNYLSFIYSTGFVICGRMDKANRKEALEIMEKYTFVLKYAYWRKPVITKYAIKVMGLNTFSILSSKYFNKTHIF